MDGDRKKIKKKMKTFKESIIDIPRRTYAKGVFDEADTNNPKIKASVKALIDKQIEMFEEPVRVWNFTVDTAHTYFSNGMLSHNAKTSGGGSSSYTTTSTAAASGVTPSQAQGYVTTGTRGTTSAASTAMQDRPTPTGICHPGSILKPTSL